MNNKILFMTLFLWVTFTGNLFAQQTKGLTFEELETAIQNISYASVDVADYDNDGDDDLIVQGALDTDDDGFADKSCLILYRNDEGVFTEVIDENFYGLHLGALKFIDIDNDEDFDIISVGQSYENIMIHFATVYENIDGHFAVKQQLQGCIYTSLDCGDIDNDGDVDMIISGISIINEGNGTEEFFHIYENNEANFIEIENDVTPIEMGCARFSDLDLDGDLDIITMGFINNVESKAIKTYTNDNGSFTENQILSDSLSTGWLDLGDFDGDGDDDFVVMGQDNNYEGQVIVYQNNNNVFERYAVLSGLSSSSSTNAIEWGDYDNDGDLDFVVSGSDDDYEDKTSLYENNNGEFNIVEAGLRQVGGCSTLAWIDFDSDNDLDLFISGFNYIGDDYIISSILHRNNTTNINQKPEKPLNLTYTKTGNISNFSWDMASDDHTNSESLTYWLRVGSLSDIADIATYEVQGTEWEIKDIDAENIYWSVQSIDAANVKSEKSFYSPISTSEINQETACFKLYPNPASDYITISDASKSMRNNIQKVEIFNTNGILANRISDERATNKINVTFLEKGIYFIKIYFKEKCEVLKFTKL